MEKYIGSKIVQAEPMSWADYAVKYRDQAVVTPDMVQKEGYLVVYADGYISWSPKEAFEEAYRRTDGLSFGLALEACKMGKRITRAGWNGKGQYVELGTDFQYDTLDSCCAVAHHEDIGSTALVFCGTRGRQVGWLASQSDMLADDWMILE